MSKQLWIVSIAGVVVVGGSLAVSRGGPAAPAAQGSAARRLAEDKKDEKKEEMEEKVPVDKLPAAVVEGVKKKYPDGTITDAEKQKDKDGKTSYELDVKTGGKVMEVVVAEDGKVLSSKEDKDDEKK